MIPNRRFDSRTAAFLLLIVLGCVTAEQRDPTGGRVAISDGWLAMGTFFEIEIRIRPENEVAAREFIDWAREEIPRLERIYSRHDPESEVSRLNDSLSADDVLGRELAVDDELQALLFLAIEIWEGSGGAFDMTIGPLVAVWTRATELGEWPSLAALRAAKNRVGSEAFLLPDDGRLEVLKRGMQVDLDGISKGRVLDRLREAFERRLPGAAALLNFGESSLLAIGDPDGSGWRLTVRSRHASGAGPRILALRDRALSVSSSLDASSEIGGERVSHVIDPRTGSTVAQGVETFVVADRASIADGWSTALLVIGANRTALRLIEKAGLEADIREQSGQSVSTPGWESLLAQP